MKTINDYAELVKEKHALNKTIAPVETDLTDASREYHIGEQFIINGGLFKAKTEIAQHDELVLNTNYEPADNLTEQIKNAGGGTGTDPRLDVFENNIAPVETDETDASKEYQVGEQLILNNILYDVIAAISEHDVITTTGSGANIEPADPITSEIQTLAQNDADIWNNIYANGSINILENNAVTNTVNGITFTVYEDGTIKANGTSTVDYETFCFCGIKNKMLKAGSYKLSGCPSGGALNKYGVRVSLSDVKDGAATAEATEYGDGATLTLASDKYYRTYTGVFIAARATVDNIIFKPMLTLASQPNSDYAHYVPYAKTNKELTENYNIKTAFVSVPATYHGGTVANINFEKRNGVVHAYWAGGTPTFPAQGTEYEIGDIPEGFIPSQVQTGYGIDMNSFAKGMYLQLRTNGKIYIFGYNTGTGGTVNALVSLVYFA